MKELNEEMVRGAFEKLKGASLNFVANTEYIKGYLLRVEQEKALLEAADRMAVVFEVENCNPVYDAFFKEYRALREKMLAPKT